MALHNEINDLCRVESVPDQMNVFKDCKAASSPPPKNKNKKKEQHVNHIYSLKFSSSHNDM